MSFHRGASLRLMCVAAAGVLISTSALAQPRGGQEGTPPPASFAATSIPGVVAAGTKIELVATGLGRTEGPVAMQDGSMLVSSSNRILKVDLSGNVSTFIADSNETNAMGWDLKGRLVSVQRARGNEKVGVLYPAAQVTTLADEYQGRPFSSLNDLALDKRGGIYFTDTEGIYYLPPGGSVTRIIDDVPNPNGVVLSPDERTLYVHNKDGAYMLAFDVAPDGTISNRRNFARYKSVRIPGHADPSWDTDNGADGMAVDSEGRVYAATNVGVEVFSPRGDLLGIIPVQWGAESNRIRHPQNVAFGGADRKILYMVGAASIYKVRTLSQGPQRPTK
jgi:gluconolactonase